MAIKKNGNNAGMSLIELLVALAVSSMVIIATMALLTNGISSYRRQTITAQLQEEADLALTHISDAIFEAEVVNVKMSDSENGSTEEFYIKKDQNYGYEFKKAEKKLYVLTKDEGTGNYIKSVLCTNVTYFKVQVLTDSVMVEDIDSDSEDEIVDVKDTVQVKVSIKVEDGDISREGARVTGVRNSMTVEDIELLGFSVDEYQDVKYLKNHGFLADE